MSKHLEMIPDTFTFCSRCAARVEIGRVPYGSPIKCSSCGFEFTIFGGSASSRAGEGGGKRGGAGTDEGGTRWSDGTPEVSCGDPPYRLVFANTFSFPLRAAALGRFLALAIVAIAVVAVANLAVWCARADHEGVDPSTRVLLWHGLLFSSCFGLLVALGWTWAASAWGVTVIRDTFYGCDDVRRWPDPLALEGLSEWMFVASSAILATLPGLTATGVWQWLNIPRSAGIAVCVPVLFPIFLLSVLETDSPVNPLSSAVWRSLFRGWRVWMVFYGVTLLAAALAAAIVTMGFLYGGWPIGVVLLGVLVALEWLIYCRLLGRLAWYCSGRPLRREQGGDRGVDESLPSEAAAYWA